MILTGDTITEEVRAGRIEISPFDELNITTNSYDLALGNKVLRYTSAILDPKVKPEYELIEIPFNGLIMRPGDFLLGCTEEKIGSDHYVPLIHARSGTARMGLFVHITADLIDIGSHGNSTLQLYATLPVKLYAGMRIAQVSFWVPKGEIVLYKGKYQGSEGPQPSKTWEDFKKKGLPRDLG
jgi:dCTP deaminase